MAEQEGKTIHSVAKAIRLLDLLTAAGQPASLTELYQKTGWHLVSAFWRRRSAG